MPFKYKNRALETSTSIGTGDFTLDGAFDESYFTFHGDGDRDDDIGVGDEFSYAILDEEHLKSEGGKATCLTVTPTFTFSRDTIEFSSNKVGSAYLPVDFLAGPKKVFITPTAADLQALQALIGNQTANVVYAGPASGSDAPASFRALVELDFPPLAYVPTAAQIGRKFAASPSDGTSGLITLRAIVSDDLPETLTGKTLTTVTLTSPTIGDYSNAGHTHQNAVGGGTLTTAAIASGTFADAFIPNLNASKINEGFFSGARGGLGVDASAFAGLLKMTAGVASVATAGTDYITPTGIENVSNKTITLGSINNTPIGATTPSTGKLTTLETTLNTGIGAAPGTYRLEVTSTLEPVLKITNSTSSSSWYQFIGHGNQFAAGYFGISQGVPAAANYEMQFLGSGVVKVRTALSTPAVNSNMTGVGESSTLSWFNTGGNFNGYLAVGPRHGNSGSAGQDVRLYIGPTAQSTMQVRLNSEVVLMSVLQSGYMAVGSHTPTSRLHAVETNTAANDVTNVLTIERTSIGAGVAGYGEAILFAGKSSTTASRSMARWRSIWDTATDASRKAKAVGSVWDASTEVDVIELTTLGIQTALDAKVTASAKGLVLTDRTDGTFWRMRVISGVLSIESA